MTVHLRSAIPAPQSLDPKARTVEAIVSTGAAVERGGYVERLDLRGMDLSRLVGAPVLDAHRASSTRDQLGVIEAAEVRAEGLWVRIRFRNNEAARAVLADIGEGTIRGLSIGYSVTEWKETRENGRRVRTAARWTPIEVSIVPVPADPAAHFRTSPNLEEEQTMQTEEQTAERQAETMTRAQINAEIRSIATTAGLAREWADQQIDAEVTPEDARRAAFEAIRTRSAGTQTRTARATITMDHTDPAVIATRAGEALFARAHADHNLSDSAREFAHMNFVDHARAALIRNGMNTTALSADTILSRALHTTSDFPLILADTVNRTLRQAYEAAPSGVRQLARQTTVRDFRAKRSAMLGEAPELEKVLEAGEFKHGTINESAETYRAETYGKIFAFSRQAMINDDLGALVRIPTLFGQQAMNLEAKILTGLVEANPNMSDNVAVFHAASHGNLLSPATTIEADLDTARTAMRRQKGLSGMSINVTPRFVLVPPELETDMEKALSAVQAAKTDDVNPFTSLTLVVEPRLTSATRWYVVADPALIDGLEYAYLEGAPGPQIETKVGFEVDGMQIKVRLDFGAGWIDHRGWYRVGA